MRLTTPPLIISDTDPFKNDLFNRKSFSESLVNLIKNIDEEIVICLDAQWGEGKTTFIRMWKSQLTKNGIRNVYIDAFENDFIDDAFTVISSNILKLIEDEITSDSEAKLLSPKFKKKASRVALQSLALCAKIGIKAVTLGAINSSDISEISSIKDDIAKGVSEYAGTFIQDRISSYTEQVKDIHELKGILSEIAEKNRKETNSPLVIIIDELDRCKPTFALEIIERIKHIFSVRNIIFVLVMNKIQIEESVRCLYGQNIDASSYLQKFISFDCKLPKKYNDKYDNDYLKYCRKLFELHDIEMSKDNSFLLNPLSALSVHFNLSLRHLEKIFSHLSLFYGAINSNTLQIDELIALLSVLRISRQNLYFDLAAKKTSYKQFEHLLGLDEIHIDKLKKIEDILFYVKFCLYDEDEFNNSPYKDKFDNDMKYLLNRFNVNRQDIIPFYCSMFDSFRIL